MATAPRDPREYELMAILLPDKQEDETSAMIARVTKFITDIQGNITETLTDSPWGRRRLAYTIRHESVDYRDGFYIVVHFEAVPNMISDLERELRLDSDVIRYLLVSDDPNAGEPESANVPETTGDETEQPDAPRAVEESPAPQEAPATQDSPVREPQADTTEQVEEASENVTEPESPAPADAPSTESPVEE